MKINPLLSGADNLTALINDKLQAAYPTFNFSYGDPSTIVPGEGNENHNTEIVATWTGDASVTGDTTLQYTRRTLAGNFPAFVGPVDILNVDIIGGGVHAKIATALGLTLSEIEFTDPETPPASTETASYTLNVVDNSKLYLPGELVVEALNVSGFGAPYTAEYIFDQATVNPDPVNGDTLMGVPFSFAIFGDSTKTSAEVYAGYLSSQIAGTMTGGEPATFTADNISAAYYSNPLSGPFGIRNQITPATGLAFGQDFLTEKFLLQHSSDTLINKTTTTPPAFAGIPGAIMDLTDVDAFAAAIRAHFKWPVDLLGPYHSSDMANLATKTLGITIPVGAAQCMVNCTVITGERTLTFQR